LIDWLGWREGLLALRHIWRNDFHPLRQSPLHEALQSLDDHPSSSAILRSLAQALKAEPRCLPECGISTFCGALARPPKPASRATLDRPWPLPTGHSPSLGCVVDPVIK